MVRPGRVDRPRGVVGEVGALGGRDPGEIEVERNGRGERRAGRDDRPAGGQGERDRVRPLQIDGDGLGHARGVPGDVGGAGGDGERLASRLIAQSPVELPGPSVVRGVLPGAPVDADLHGADPIRVADGAGEPDPALAQPVGGGQDRGGDGQSGWRDVHDHLDGVIQGLRVIVAVHGLGIEHVDALRRRQPDGGPISSGHARARPAVRVLLQPVHQNLHGLQTGVGGCPAGDRVGRCAGDHRIVRGGHDRRAKVHERQIDCLPRVRARRAVTVGVARPCVDILHPQ